MTRKRQRLGPRGKRVGPDADAWKRGRGWEQRMAQDSGAKTVTAEVLGAAVEVLEWLGRDGWHRSGYLQSKVQIDAGSKPVFGVMTLKEICRSMPDTTSELRRAGIEYLVAQGWVGTAVGQDVGLGRPPTFVRLLRPAGDLETAKMDLIGDMLCTRFVVGARVGLMEVQMALPPVYRDSEKLARALMWQMCLWGDCRTDPFGAGVNADAWIFC